MVLERVKWAYSYVETRCLLLYRLWHQHSIFDGSIDDVGEKLEKPDMTSSITYHVQSHRLANCNGDKGTKRPTRFKSGRLSLLFCRLSSCVNFEKKVAKVQFSRRACIIRLPVPSKQTLDLCKCRNAPILPTYPGPWSRLGFKSHSWFESFSTLWLATLRPSLARSHHEVLCELLAPHSWIYQNVFEKETND